MKSERRPSAELERPAGKPDNDRKFVLDAIDHEYEPPRAKYYDMTTTWFPAQEGVDKKIVHKVHQDGTQEYVLITKVPAGAGKRLSDKQPIEVGKYNELVELAGKTALKSPKRRYEFKYSQSNIEYNIKYDVFDGSDLRVMEVEATSGDEQERLVFDMDRFEADHNHAFRADEVTGQAEYTGARIVDIVYEYRIDRAA